MGILDYFKSSNNFNGTFDKESKIISRVLKGNKVEVNSPSSIRFYNKSDGSDGYVTGRPGFNKDTSNSGGQTIHMPSTAIESFSYDPNTQNLKVVFKGSNQAYNFVAPPEVFDDFCRSSSKGRFVNSVLKHYYRDPSY